MGLAETVFGKNLVQGGWAREDLVITCKINPATGGKIVNQGLSRKHMIEGVNNSLNRMGLEYADVVYLHRPDADVPISETIRAANALIDMDKCFYWGTSEFSAEQIMECHEYCSRYGLIPPIVEQPEYNMLKRDTVEVDYIPLYDKYGMGLTTWGALQGGMLTGKFNDGNIPDDSRVSNSPFKGFFQVRYDTRIANNKEVMIGKLQALGKLAADNGCSQTQLSIAWVMKNPDLSSAILGASKVEQLDEALGSMDIYKRMTPELLNQIEEILENRPTPPLNWRTWQPFAPRR
jgi:aryl-alcohol dehydrogenase-like predicted oxidoreductase